MKNLLNGTWLMIKDASTYCRPMFLEFKKNQILHYEDLEKPIKGVLEKKFVYSEEMSEIKYKILEKDRIMFYQRARTHTWISDTESRVEETEFKQHYHRIVPTKTNLSDEEIQKMKFKVIWNEKSFVIAFNKTLGSKALQEVTKKIGREGKKIVLEKMKKTYFVSICNNGNRETLIPIKEIDVEKIVLYGFPKEPDKIMGYAK